MSSPLPEFVDPRRLASQGVQFTGAVGLDELARLRDALMGIEGEVQFSLAFSRDSKNRARITGQVQAELVLECQRCLKAMTYPVNTELDLAVIQVPEEAERLPESIDPVWVEEDSLRLMDLVEDELILAIPQVPRHETDFCGIDSNEPVVEGKSDEKQIDGESDKPNPFAILAGLKSDK